MLENSWSKIRGLKSSFCLTIRLQNCSRDAIVLEGLFKVLFLETTILQAYYVSKSASNVYRRRGVQLFSMFKHVLDLDKWDLREKAG